MFNILESYSNVAGEELFEKWMVDGVENTSWKKNERIPRCFKMVEGEGCISSSGLENGLLCVKMCSSHPNP